MNAQTTHENRDVQTPAGAETRSADRQVTDAVETHSVRILLEAPSTHRCDNCNTEISIKTRYRHVSIREADGELSEHSYCNLECAPTCCIE